jgi:Mg2+/Co2+ transporter CorC
MSDSIELTVELAYFASTNIAGFSEEKVTNLVNIVSQNVSAIPDTNVDAKIDAYKFKEELTETKSVITVPLNHPLLK